MIQKGTYSIKINGRNVNFHGHFYTDTCNKKEFTYFYDGTVFLRSQANDGENAIVRSLAKHELRKIYGHDV